VGLLACRPLPAVSTHDVSAQRTYGLEVSCGKDLADRLHERIPDDDGDITSRVPAIGRGSMHEQKPDSPFGLFCQRCEVGRGQSVRGCSHIELEHPAPGLDVGQWNVDSLLETGISRLCRCQDRHLPSLDGRVELPWDVCRTEDEHTRVVIAHTVDLASARCPIAVVYQVTHLDQELRLDAPARLALALSSRTRQRVNLVNEDDCRLLLPRHREQLLHQSTVSSRPAPLQFMARLTAPTLPSIY